jgi:hypothetical protein
VDRVFRCQGQHTDERSQDLWRAAARDSPMPPITTACSHSTRQVGLRRTPSMVQSFGGRGSAR